MGERTIHVSANGTFDVENYGDLLFTLIAEHELARRAGGVTMTRYGYREKRAPTWLFDVAPLERLPDAIDEHDLVLVGGGDIIRFDKHVAPGYVPASPEVHHPTGYWLAPTLIAHARGVPVAWNAVGVCSDVPRWAAPLLTLALRACRYVSVRESASRDALASFAPGKEIEVVPDTAFGVTSLFDTSRRSEALEALLREHDVGRRYVVVQTTRGLEPILALFRANPDLLGDRTLVTVPIGPILGDDASLLGDLPGAVHLSFPASPVLLAELIAHADAVVGSSLHLAITAQAAGVSVLRPAEAANGKYRILAGLDTVHAFGHDVTSSWVEARLGRGEPGHRARAAQSALAVHWDRIADIAVGTGTAARVPVRASLATWQTLPCALEELDTSLAARTEDLARVTQARDAGALESADLRRALAQSDARARGLEAQVEARDAEVVALRARLDAVTLEVLGHDGALKALSRSASWRVTEPIRALRRRALSLPEPMKPPLVDLDRVAQHPLHTHPYRWAAIDRLFRPEVAAELAATYPRDHFKTVAGYDGEKGYEYESRALLPMYGAEVAFASSLSPAWRMLAQDLGSTAYRSAMSRMTGLDLSAAPLEVNVFHFAAGAWLGPHVDLADKVVTHVLYFNDAWTMSDGGCLHVLGSSEMDDLVHAIEPVVGNSAVLVRSDRSWHAVSRVREGCLRSRRSITVTFYRPGSVSTMWPPGDTTPLHTYAGA